MFKVPLQKGKGKKSKEKVAKGEGSEFSEEPSNTLLVSPPPGYSLLTPAAASSKAPARPPEPSINAIPKSQQGEVSDGKEGRQEEKKRRSSKKKKSEGATAS